MNQMNANKHMRKVALVPVPPSAPRPQTKCTYYVEWESNTAICISNRALRLNARWEVVLAKQPNGRVKNPAGHEWFLIEVQPA